MIEEEHASVHACMSSPIKWDFIAASGDDDDDAKQCLMHCIPITFSFFAALIVPKE